MISGQNLFGYFSSTVRDIHVNPFKEVLHCVVSLEREEKYIFSLLPNLSVRSSETSRGARVWQSKGGSQIETLGQIPGKRRKLQKI